MEAVINQQANLASKREGHFNGNASIYQDYTAYLKQHNIPCSTALPYLFVGDAGKQNGWLIQISLVRQQMGIFADRVFPFLVQCGLSFTLPANLDQHTRILDGRNGLQNVAKVVSIYVPDDRRLGFVIAGLIERTKNLKGPIIHNSIGMCHPLYISWGTLTQPCLRLPEGKEAEGKKKQYADLLKSLKFGKVKWPALRDLVPPQKVMNRIMKHQYVPIQALKADPKGSVWKSIRLNKIFDLDWCVLKEGEGYQSFDDEGRDIRDRLNWQYELHNRLSGDLRVPKAYDLFSIGNKTVLSVQFITGISMSEFVNNLFSGAAWNDIPKETRCLLLDYLVQAVDLVKHLHLRGYVHRDLNPENFIITEKGSVYLLDFELCYSKNERYPMPAFSLGTYGYMSPQQFSLAEPGLTDDVYALGATLIRALTGVSPLKFNCSEPEALRGQLSYFVTDQAICTCVVACLDPDAAKRPALEAISNALTLHKSQIMGYVNTTLAEKKEMDKQVLLNTVKAGLSTLLSGYYTDEQKYWRPWVRGREGFLDGAFYLLAKAASLHIVLEGDQEVFDRNLQVLAGRLAAATDLNNAGPINELRYCAITWLELEKSALAKPGQIEWNTIKDVLFQSDTNGFHNIGELTERGFILLHFLGMENSVDATKQLQGIFQCLINHQHPDGSWNTSEGNKGSGSGRQFGLYKGMAGLVSLLINYAGRFDEGEADHHALKGLDFLLNRRITHDGHRVWPVSGKSVDIDPWLGIGFTGIAYVFIQAYERYGQVAYKNAAVEALLCHPEHIASTFTGTFKGLSGLGEVYLEAGRVFQDEHWLVRANHIAQFFLHTGQEVNGYRFWQADDHEQGNSSLPWGHSGIIHFLLRTLEPGHLPFPFITLYQ